MKISLIAKMIAGLVLTPMRRGRFAQRPLPVYDTDYDPPELALSVQDATLLAKDVPMGKTRNAGETEFPPPVFAGCDEPLTEGAADLRGVWRVYRGPMKGHVERIEQAGDRVAITAGQVIHDMRTTGKTKDGVNEVAGYGGSPISVAAQWENGSLNLRPGGGRVVAVTRRLDDKGEMRWRYGPYFNRLRRISPPREVELKKASSIARAAEEKPAAEPVAASS